MTPESAAVYLNAVSVLRMAVSEVYICQLLYWALW